jgi:hypothetical protein
MPERLLDDQAADATVGGLLLRMSCQHKHKPTGCSWALTQLECGIIEHLPIGVLF